MKTKNGTKVCCFANCKSDGRRLPTDTDIHFVPFAKPCLAYRKEGMGISTSDEHTVSKCQQCCRALRWLHLARRTDKGLKHITKDTYVCSKHFVGGRQTIRCDEDPMPANTTGREIVISDGQTASKQMESLKDLRNEVAVTPVANVETLSHKSNTNPALALDTNRQKRTRGRQPGVEFSSRTAGQVAMDEFLQSQVKCGWASVMKEQYASFIIYDDTTFSCSMEVRVWYNREPLMCRTYVLGQALREGSELLRAQTEVKTYKELHHFMGTLVKQALCKGISNKGTVRSVRCRLFSRGSKCIQCSKYEKSLQVLVKKRLKKREIQHEKCNYRYLTAEQLLVKTKMYRKKAIELTLQLRRLRNRFHGVINNGGYCVDSNENNDLVTEAVEKANDNVEKSSS